MSNPDQPPSTSSSSEQSPGTDPRSKRNSGLFAFFKWFKPGSRESIDSASRSSSQESIASNKSIGTVASFNFVSPSAYETKVLTEKCVQIGPETDTYKARLKQRDKRRETDKNVTLRKKYNLFFNKETLLRPEKFLEDEENSKSLPLMTRAHIMEVEPQKVHRRTNSESSKVKRAGAYVHVKGKRKAPQPPGGAKLPIDASTASLKRKKRVAPTPPTPKVEVTNTAENELKSKEVLSNDYLKLDHGVLKPVKEESRPKTPQENNLVPTFNALSPSASRTTFVEAPVSPRPWYKRNSGSKEVLNKKESRYEPIERLPEVQFMRNSTLDLTLEDSLTNNEKEKKKEEKRKSGMSFLTNISELDREASEIIKNKAEYEKKMGALGTELGDIPEFMKPKETKQNDSWINPKRRSARDLIAKFNAITSVTKVTVFGASHKDKYFGKQTSLDETKQRQEQLLESHKKRIEEIDKKKEDRFSPLMKSESASAVKLGATKDDTPKMERKAWRCPKCNLENEYWRIICHVCSAIKPYFDDFSSSSKINGDTKIPEAKTSSPLTPKKEPFFQNNSERIFERSKTQIGFSALANYNANNKKKIETTKSTSSEDKDRSKVDDASKKEEREKLKKMLIEMKNSLPKRKSNILMKQNSRSSIIMENPEETNREAREDIEETNKEDKKEEIAPTEKTQEEKVAEILIGTSETIYENIKVRKSENPKPVKVSSAAQTSAVVKQVVPENTLKKLIENHKANNVYEPMKAQDFEDIYTDKNGKSVAKIYANLAQNDELSLFFNVPKNITELKNNLSENNSASFNHVNCNVNTDTIEINRLLRRLESAIAKGDMTEAAIFAKELAQLKVNCSVVRQKPQGYTGKRKGFQIEMYVEDKMSHRGPFPIDVTQTQTVAELKQQISREFEIPIEVQRWILGKELVTDDNSTLKEHNITEGCPVFLYLVAAEKKTKEDQNLKAKTQPSTSNSTAQNLNQKSSNKLELSSTKTDQNDIPICVTKFNNNNTETSKFESTEQPNVAVGQKNKLENKRDSIIGLNKVKIDAPKVVNVIPKSFESPQTNAEVVRIIPVQKEAQIQTTSEEDKNKQKETYKGTGSGLTQLPVSVTEIKVDIRPYASRSQNVGSKQQKTGLVMAKTTRVEVLQAPPLVVTNEVVKEKNLNRSSVVFSSNKTDQLASKPLDIRLKQEPAKTVDFKNSELSKVAVKVPEPLKELRSSNTPVITTQIPVENESSSKVGSETSNVAAASGNTSRPQISFGIYPNPSKLSPSPSTTSPSASGSNAPSSSQSPKIPQASISSLEIPQRSQAPMAQKEQDFEDYDSNTLKPPKEWECHLCTLLNPISSNICAVCAAIRLKKIPLRKSNKKKPAPQPQKDQTYLQLVNLDSADLVPNADVFECVVCFLEVPRGEGVTLRECLHQFCKDCLARTVEFAEDAEVKCPYRDDEYSCNIALQDREIKALVTVAVYDQYLAKSVAQAENKMEKTFHCKTPDCKGWCIFEDNVNEFRCPVCRRTNCLTCQAIRTGLNCRQYQERMKNESEIDEEAKRTKDFLEEMVEKGEAIACPTCKVILMKKWGCDWLRCSMCKTEICWVTRGARWGSGGKGDTSGGCQCGLNGVKCHPKCNYCH